MSEGAVTFIKAFILVGLVVVALVVMIAPQLEDKTGATSTSINSINVNGGQIHGTAPTTGTASTRSNTR